MCGCEKKETKTTIEFASWGSKSETDILKPLLSEFETENPDIKIDFMHIPQNYFQKIHLLFAFTLHDKMLFLLIFIKMQCPLNPREYVNCGNSHSEYRSDPYLPVQL